MPRESLLSPAPRRGVAPRRAHAPDARSELLESLLACDAMDESAQKVVEWLAANAAVRRALCAVLSPEGTQLRGVAGWGFAPARVREFVLEVEDRDEPLVRAYLAGRPITLKAQGTLNGGAHLTPPRRTPFGRAGFALVPLALDAGADAELPGLLLTEPLAAGTEAAVRWAARNLARHLARLRRLERLAQLERTSARERALLQAIINAVPDPILLTDLDGRMKIANARAELLFAATEGESEGRRRAVALNNMLFSSALSRRALQDAEPARRELLLVDPSDGTDLLYELLTTGSGEPGGPTGLVSILRNVADLRRATEEIEENYRRLRIAEADVRAERDRLDLIIDSVADPILVTDPSGNIVLMNAPAERLFTVAHERPGDEAQRVVRSNDAHFSSFVSNLFFTGADLRWRGEIALTDPLTGKAMPVEAISGKILSEHGEVNAVVTILHDRTEALEKARLYERLERASRELEQKVREATAELVSQNEILQRQRIELEQASALKSQFLANMSHEFRTPLNAILGYTAMLLQGVAGELAVHQRKHLTRVDSNARHLLTIINDILDIARIEAGKMPIHAVEFSMPELIAEVMGEVDALVPRARLAVVTEVPPGMKAIKSDRQKVKQIVLNLLTNAIKFTPQGTIRVRAELEPASDHVTIAVSDTGIGIAPEDQLKVFEDFRQADNSPTREYGGTGLGLSICRRLAGMLEGQITLSSELGKGSTFTLTFPRRSRRR